MPQLELLPPAMMRYPDGSARFAHVTFLLFTLNDTYVPAALLLAHALRKQKTQADIVCMVTGNMTRETRSALEMLFDHVIEVEPFFIPHKRRQERQDRPYLFTRMHALRLGSDGDLGFNYEKVTILDADILPLRHYDHLFTVNTPAGIINEKRENFVEYDDAGQFVVPDSVDIDGTWHWHRIYEDVCPHGAAIPKDITDAGLTDLTNLGIIGALFVLRTSMNEFSAIKADVSQPEVLKYVGDLYDLPDMQYLTVRWSGQWTNIDLRFCGLSGYPRMDVLFGNHYAGFKPWSFGKKINTLKRFARFPDFQYWYEAFNEMLASYPSLRKVKRLHKLEQNIANLQRELSL